MCQEVEVGKRKGAEEEKKDEERTHEDRIKLEYHQEISIYHGEEADTGDRGCWNRESFDLKS